MSNIVKLDRDGCTCPECGKGKLVTRTVKKEGPNQGKQFLTCVAEGCRYMEWPGEYVEPLPGHGASCPECGSKIVTKLAKRGPNEGQRFLACSNRECKHIPGRKPKVDVEPLEGHGKACPVCGEGQMLTRTVTKEGSPKHGQRFLGCSRFRDGCNHSEWPETEATAA